MSLVSALSAAWLGLFAGGLHAGGGPDHLAGVAPFAAARGRSAWRVGFAWGLGHATGAAAAATLALLLRTRWPGAEAGLSAWSETIVGVLLCVVGALGLHAALEPRGSESSSHPPHASRRTDSDLSHVHDRPPFAIGIFHGAAGASHVFGVLPALALPGTLLPALYLTGYASGSLIVITLFATALGRVGLKERPRTRRAVMILASAASLCVGVVWLALPV